MTMRNPFAHSGKIVFQGQPQDINASALTGGYVSLRNYQGAGVFIAVGAHSGNAVAVTLKQAKTVQATGAKALAFTTYYKNLMTGVATELLDKWQAVTATSNTFNIAANTNYFIPVRPGMLDVTNNFDCINVNIAAGSASTLINAFIYVWGGPEGIDNNVDHIPSTQVNVSP